MHIHAKLPVLPQQVAAQPLRPRPPASADDAQALRRVTQNKDRDDPSQSRQKQPRRQDDRPADPEPRRDLTASLAATLLELSLGQD